MFFFNFMFHANLLGCAAPLFTLQATKPEVPRQMPTDSDPTPYESPHMTWTEGKNLHSYKQKTHLVTRPTIAYDFRLH